jgi:hypothetical protein
MLVSCPLCWGQIPSQHPRIKPVPREPEYFDTERVPEPRRQNTVLPSDAPEYGQPESERSGSVIGKVTPELRRLPEGYVVGNRSARIERQGNWYVATLAPVQGLPDAPPLRILPNSQVGLLDAVLKDTTREPVFLVTGRVTEFHATNYVLIESLLEGAPTRPRPPQFELTAEPGPGGVRLQVSSAPATTPGAEPTAEEVLRQLMQNRPSRSPIPPQPSATAAATQPGAPLAGAIERKGPRWTEDTSLMDQPGRILPGDDGWSFAFEDSSLSPQLAPVRLLPNQLLETAIHLSGGGTRSVVLIISGDVTVYKGVEYLLLRKVLVRRDTGNFR